MRCEMWNGKIPPGGKAVLWRTGGAALAKSMCAMAARDKPVV